MTNAEKYLKEGVNINQMATEMVDYFDFPPYEGIGESSIEEFFEQQIKPTLTEDERVILRNLNEQIWEKIGRDKYGTLSLKTRTEDDENFFNGCYGHLFQFIKERRRIFY